MNSLIEKEKKIIEEFSFLETLEEKYIYLIEIGKKLPLINNQYLIDKYIIDNCQSKIWMILNIKKKKLIIKAYTEALLPKGILFLIIRIYSNSYINDIINYNNNFLKKIGLKNFLSPLRSNGILNIINKIKLFILNNY
ncbi:SufE family protein [Candidatus Karelsulcia muelleri]|uniref:Cysteine desulfurase subunit SufE n=1 Tax=Candidatus Karelsulcia muelleri PSPU TaxID=1189303 RepID=A0AAD1AXV6_9FLAO|nr:SufE family protein [Candidatus Karelsulcia muelleri]NJJ98832.1 SufE family protein [Candidatus Karelsulcia muelleri]BAO66258.1 cysteine desulfurase subunit SufE [Candidatus Karelsulcia muelleri PSPU]